MTGAQSFIEVPYMSSNIIKRGHVCAPKPCMATSMSSSADVIPAARMTGIQKLLC